MRRLTAQFQARRADFAGLVAALECYRGDLLAIGDEPHAPPAPRWTQDWFPRLDAALLYAMVRGHRPRRLVEVGAGHSTRFAARAVADGGLETEIACIDPAPRAALEGLAVTHLRVPVQHTDPARFRALAPGDIVFVDSSHVLRPGGDVDFMVNRVLPVLPKGVLVHFHDIFLPGDYPPDWAWRGYDEQDAVAALLEGRHWRLLFASRYVAETMAGELAAGVIAELPLVEGARESSLWLRKLA